jgi:hypothetical protein
MTFLWFIVWLVSDLVGDSEHLTAAPVNGWTGALILAVALDLASHHAKQTRRKA